MLIECQECEAIVDAQIIGDYVCLPEETGLPAKITFCKCPSCSSPLVILQEENPDGLDAPLRLYPSERKANYNLPKELRNSFDESLKCQKAKCYTAAAMMCRRTLEGLCKHHDKNSKNLATGIQSLHSKGIIDKSLFEWAEALRRDGNLAAHDMQATISGDDAKDLIDFSEAILDYVFVLHDRFEEYKRRQEEKKKLKKKWT